MQMISDEVLLFDDAESFRSNFTSHVANGKYVPVFSPFPVQYSNPRLLFPQAFAPFPSFVGKSALATSTALDACRVNAKKEKRKRNRENMRKFQQKRGTSRRKIMKKLRSNDSLRVSFIGV